LQPLLEGKMEEIKRNVALRFMSVGAWSYLAAYGWLAFLALPGVRQTTVFTMTTNATQSLLIFLFWGNILSGSVYALLPVSRNMGWPSHPALTWHFWFTSIGAGIMVSGYALAGIFQGLALNDPGVPMGTVASYLRPFLVIVLIGQILWWAGQMFFSSLLFSSLLRLFPSTAPMAVFPSKNPVSTTP
jgi:cbb3-type cytochrome oxidase subunit 1